MFLLYAALTFSVLDVQPRQFPDSEEIYAINSDEDWQQFSVEPPPRVDFKTATVIVVFAGERPTGGWRTRVLQVDRTGDTCKVNYEVVGPPRGAIVTQVITHPYAVILVRGKCSKVTAVQQKQRSR
jgi:hypothetical protein